MTTPYLTKSLNWWQLWITLAVVLPVYIEVTIKMTWVKRAPWGSLWTFLGSHRSVWNCNTLPHILGWTLHTKQGLGARTCRCWEAYSVIKWRRVSARDRLRCHSQISQWTKPVMWASWSRHLSLVVANIWHNVIASLCGDVIVRLPCLSVV